MSEKAPWLDIIHLPRFTALALVTTVQRIATAAKSLGELPKPIALRLKVLRDGTLEVERVLAERRQVGEATGAERTEADLNVDDAIRGLESWLSAMRRIPNKAAKATAAYAAYFGEGLTFITVDYDTEWAEISTRLKHSDDSGVSADIEEMGGKDVLDHVRKMHKEYGKVLGITTVQAAPAKNPLTVPLANAFDALRRFVAVVLAHGANSDIDPSVVPVVNALLEPLEAQRAKNAGKRGRDEAPGEGEATPADGEEPTGDEGKKKPGPGGSD